MNEVDDMFSSCFFALLYFLRYGLFLISYVSGQNNFPKPLSASEEKRYLELAAKGDKGAKDVLVERKLRLVAHIAKKYNQVSGCDDDDLISIGTIGLIKAIASFDYTKQARLATYAARCIEKPTLSSWLFWRKKGKEMLLFQRNGGYSISQARICI